MFERFTDDARQAVVLAQEEAVALHHGWIGTEHLLLGVLRDRRATGRGCWPASASTPPACATTSCASWAAARTTSTADALATLGIDLDAVRERVERAFGPGALGRRGAAGAAGSGATVPFTRARQEGARAHAARGGQPRRRATCAPSTSCSGCCARATASPRACWPSAA